MPERNILEKKLSEIVDVPSTQKMAIFGRGSLLGEEDFVNDKLHSCTLICYSTKGSLLQITSEYFESFRNNKHLWR